MNRRELLASVIGLVVAPSVKQERPSFDPVVLEAKPLTLKCAYPSELIGLLNKNGMTINECRKTLNY